MRAPLAIASLGAALCLAVAAGSAQAAVFVVDAPAASASGAAGPALGAVTLTMGQFLVGDGSPNDPWSAGALIGANFGLLTLSGFSGPNGAPAGQIGPGSDRGLDAHFAGRAWGSGVLTKFYWDSDTPGSFGSVNVDLSVIPEPAAWSLMIAGFGAAGAMLRRRRAMATA